jgi:predicted DNA-binding protein (UPF0251 family)
VSSWVIGIAYRRALCAFRAERRLCVGGAQSAGDENSQSGDAQEQFETTEWLGKALLKLPLEQRTALELMYHAGYSCEEVGEIMGCPASTVKTRLFHARRKLRLALPVAAGLTTEAVNACTAGGFRGVDEVGANTIDVAFVDRRRLDRDLAADACHSRGQQGVGGRQG